MGPLPSVHKVEQKAFRGAEQDGLVELLTGLSLFAIAARAFSPYLIIVMLAPVFLFAPILKALRRRFTWPRVGYVKLIPEDSRRLLGRIFLVVFILFILLAGGLFIFSDPARWELWVRWFPAFLGTLMSGMFISLVSKSGCARYSVLAALSVLGGFGLSIAHFEAFAAGTVIYLLGMETTLVIIGAISFARFIRSNPQPVQENV